MYDRFSNDYDRFVNWHGRLNFEMPFLEAQLCAVNANRVLDAACGTGMHTLALAQRGFQTAGADLSRGMVERARANAAEAGLDVPFVEAGFGGLQAAFAAGGRLPFDALLCLGNSLPHVLSASELAAALADFAACLRPGGLLLLQNRNFDAVMARRERWMEPQSHREGEREWLFLRLYDYLPDGLIDFNVVTLQREGGLSWRQSVDTSRLRPLLHDELHAALAAAGFAQVQAFGGLDGSPFDARSSGNLVVGARRA